MGEVEGKVVSSHDDGGSGVARDASRRESGHSSDTAATGDHVVERHARPSLDPDRDGTLPFDANELRGHQSALIELSRFEGPLPHPAILEQYERAVPGSAERIIAMAERSLDAEITAEMEPIRAEARAYLSTSIAVAWLPWLMIVAAVVLAMLNVSTVATAILGIAGIAGGGAQLIQSTRQRMHKPDVEPKRAKP